MELGLVMRVDEPEHPVHYAEGALADGALELLNGAFAALYVQQLIYCALFLTEQLEHASVHEYRQQMEPGQMREKLALAYLLVSAERHLPGREGHEHEAIGLEQRLAFGDEALLIGYMLYDVVAHNQVKTVFQLLEFEDIGRDESGGNAFLLKILDGRLYLAGGYVYTGYVASTAGKRQQIAALAAAYFNDSEIGTYSEETLYVGQEIFLAGYGKLVKILLVVTMSGLHSFVYPCLIVCEGNNFYYFRGTLNQKEKHGYK